MPKNIRINSTDCRIMKIPNKTELQQIVINHSSDINFKDFMILYKTCTAEPYCFLVKDTNLQAENHLRFTYNLLESIIHSLYLAKENTNAILTNSENSKTSDPLT